MKKIYIGVFENAQYFVLHAENACKYPILQIKFQEVLYEHKRGEMSDQIHKKADAGKSR